MSHASKRRQPHNEYRTDEKQGGATPQSVDPDPAIYGTPHRARNEETRAGASNQCYGLRREAYRGRRGKTPTSVTKEARKLL
jgi:hypothetical protein